MHAILYCLVTFIFIFHAPIFLTEAKISGLKTLLGGLQKVNIHHKSNRHSFPLPKRENLGRSSNSPPNNFPPPRRESPSSYSSSPSDSPPNHFSPPGRKALGNITDIELTITEADGEYLIDLSIGTPPVYRALVKADTGSDLTWIQCYPCYNCYSQDAPFFDPPNSSTYGVYPCDSDPCKALPYYACLNKFDLQEKNACGYYASTGIDTFSIGSLSHDTIAFNSRAGWVRPISQTIFGCGFINEATLATEVSAGVVGLGVGPLSLINQLGPKIDYRFSYCLLPIGSNRTSKLSLGKQTIARRRGVVSTPLITFQNVSRYYVTLQGVTVGREAFSAAGKYGSNGTTAIYSGMLLTLLEPNLYSDVEAAVRKSLGHLTPVKLPAGYPELLCYEADPRRVKFPDMAFQFGEAGLALNLTTANVFLMGEDWFCMAILPSVSDVSMIGSVVQTNFEVEFDIKKKLVSFAPSHCAAEA
ncbi:aspartic proteinase CDR1-like [Malania oleifera]|uniref:aspartic proteinase CDR1-like n=1 Tax=Malania oleifera TaxID=397392 RepID=UPI0025ADA31B|nr:aspartic proteinase CDR1-like [Malania oleifera]